MNFASAPIVAAGQNAEKGSIMPMLPLIATAELGGSLVSGNLHVGLAAVAVAISIGWIGATASSAVGRNPGAATKVLVQSILAIAFAEAIVFYVIFLVK